MPAKAPSSATAVPVPARKKAAAMGAAVMKPTTRALRMLGMGVSSPDRMSVLSGAAAGRPLRRPDDDVTK
ncbi:hypothetical protein GCM10012280_22940 [Wenjunlia tyrosinilytica]|uniref:Uncharacterized protein n=1 Tax=Wenjunlia tyrosinilytica TaxID=1544741 RepID=A0A917ZN64_9ACTN|nr:hypothetical protein GCM10012280_22940 [Wenjunlia tyrosinilytica]